MMTTEAQKLPNGWQWVEIKDVADIIVPTRDKPKRFCGDIPWITLPDLDGFFINTAKNLLTHEDAAEVGNRLMPPNTVLLSCAGSLGKVTLTTREVYANQQFYGLVAKANLIDPIFLAFSLKRLGEDFFFQLAGVSTVGFFSKDKALGIKIALPPLAEQKRIAAIAQKADRLRRTRRYALQLSDTYLQSVFLEMFGDPVTNPKGLPITDLGSVCSLIRDGTHKTPSYVPSGVPFITVKNIVTGTLDFQDTKFISQEEHFLLTKRAKPEQGDILVSKDGSIGIPCLVDTDKEFSIFVSVALLKLRHKLVNSQFLAVQIRSDAVQSQIREGTKGIAIRHLHLEDFHKLKILLPPLPLQEKFAQIVQKFERLRTQQREAERQAEHLFQTLLHRAFRGELTPQHVNDEPASVLLEEIGAEQAQAEAEAKAATQAMGDAAEYLGTKAKQQDTEPIQLTLPGIE